MSGAVHTPGPWSVNEWQPDDLLIESPAGVIASLVLNGRVGIEKWRANAALIAAAPQMLDALLEVQRVVKAGEDVPLGDVNAVIRLAEGKVHAADVSPPVWVHHPRPQTHGTSPGAGALTVVYATTWPNGYCMTTSIDIKADGQLRIDELFEMSKKWVFCTRELRDEERRMLLDMGYVNPALSVSGEVMKTAPLNAAALAAAQAFGAGIDDQSLETADLS